MHIKKTNQTLNSFKSLYLLFLFIFLAIRADAQQIFSSNSYPFTDFRQPLDITPVSYTHLDVYKRQQKDTS